MVSQTIKVAFLLLLLCGCKQKKSAVAHPSLPDYDLTNPVIIHLKTELDEISGIVFYPKDTSVFAVNDELGVLYKIYLRKKIEVRKWKFSGAGDYEDLVLLDSTFYVLQSNGSVRLVNFFSNDSIATKFYQQPIRGVNNFETLYADEKSGKLVMICKSCETDNKKTFSAYAFNPADETFSDEPYFTIDASLVGKQLSGKVKFKPSAAAIHPVTKELYLISADAKAIAVAGSDGEIKAAYPLDPAFFKQPEGLTFTPSGDMLISNESAGTGAPNILLFTYKPSPHEKG